MSGSEKHDRRGFETPMKLSQSFVAVGCIVLVFINWKIGFFIVLLFGYIYCSCKYLCAIPENNPKNFSYWFHSQTTKRRPCLLCYGDSIFHGTFSSNIMPHIPTRLAEQLCMKVENNDNNNQQPFKDPIWVVNAGQNWFTSHVLLNERLNPTLEILYPDYVVIMIGTNDVLAMHSRRYRTFMCLVHSILTRDDFNMLALERNLLSIVKQIRETSPKVEIGICTLPPIGQDLTSPINTLIKESNAIIEKVVDDSDERTSMIPVFQQLEAMLEKTRKKGNRRDWNFGWTVFVHMLLQLALSTFGLSHNFLSILIGNGVTSDGIHLNDTGRDIVVDLIVEWLKVKNVAKVIAIKSL